MHCLVTSLDFQYSLLGALQNNCAQMRFTSWSSPKKQRKANTGPQPNIDGGTEHSWLSKVFTSQEEGLYCINQEAGYICTAPQQSLTWQKLFQKHIRKPAYTSPSISTQSVVGSLFCYSWETPLQAPWLLKAQRSRALRIAACSEQREIKNGMRTYKHCKRDLCRIYQLLQFLSFFRRRPKPAILPVYIPLQKDA